MIYVRVEMWPKGSRARRYLLGEALIENRTGTGSSADYRALLSKKGGFRTDEGSMARTEVKNVWRDLPVLEFRRSKRGFWQLLHEALSAACSRA